MPTAPISLCMIVKNEAGQLRNCLQSIRPYVQEIVIVDTGSTDDTPSIAKEFADKFEIFTECNDDQGRIINFSKARQRSFDLASNDWVMWIDGDDEVVNAQFLSHLINLNQHDHKMIMLPYEYSRDNRGNVTCLHWRERIFYPKKSFKWQGPIHEVVVPIEPNTVMHRNEDMRIVHRREESGKVIENGRNLRILKDWYEKNGESDVRQLYYLGLEYGNNGDVDNALKFHKRYIELSGWDEEKFMSCMKVADHYQALGKHDDSITWALKALTIREGWAEPYFSLSRSYYFIAQAGGPQEKRNWEKCIHFAEIGLKLPPTETILFVNPMERNYDIHRYLNLAYNKVGKVDDALISAKTGLASNPDDDNLKCNIAIYEEFISERAFNESSNILARTKDRDWFLNKVNSLFKEEPEKLVPIIDIEPTAKPKIIKFKDVIESNKKDNWDIVFFVGFSAEHWNPDSITTKGIGGSETAVWEMGRRLTKKGHRVRVFGDCKDMEGIFEGVEFLHFEKFKDVETDVFISSRRVHTVDDSFGLKSKLNLCWVHDVHCGSHLNHSRSLRFDKFLTLSNWHRNFFLNQYDFIHPSQVMITRNGIDLNRFSHTVIRNPHKAVYSSSPDRGLQSALDSWHLVREKIPDAEFHIYYGFESWKASAILNGDYDQLNIVNHLEKLIEAKQHLGVVYHGRIGQQELAREFMSAGVWAYPTWFSETSCQLAGSLIFTKNGMIPIEKIKVDDLVLTHKGRFRKVTKLIRKNYYGDLYKVKRQKNCNPIVLTEEHPLYSVSFHRNSLSKGNRVYSKNNINYEWKTPSDINIGLDYLFTPKMSGGERKSIILSDYIDLEVKDGKICTNHSHPIYKSENNEIELTEDLMYLFGLFAAEGSCSKLATRGGVPSAITYSFHINEIDLIEKVKNKFGGEVVPNSENGVSVRFYHSVWGHFFINTIGSKRNKKIPDFVWDCPIELQMAFANGMYDGDGTFNDNPKGNGQTTKPFHTYTSVSPSLTYGFAQLLTNNGIYPSITYCEERDNYDVHWSDNPRSPWHQETDEGFATRIKSVEIEHYDGLVYNFEVEEDESYVTDRTVVHNCITAMEAQAAGLHIVTSPIAALNETVGNRGVMIHGDWLSDEYKKSWASAVADAMERNDYQIRSQNQDYAFKNFGMDDLAVNWEEMIGELLKEVELNVVVPYKSAV